MRGLYYTGSFLEHIYVLKYCLVHLPFQYPGILEKVQYLFLSTKKIIELRLRKLFWEFLQVVAIVSPTSNSSGSELFQHREKNMFSISNLSLAFLPVVYLPFYLNTL